MNILLFVHVIISVLLIAVILLQRTASDSLSGLSGGGGFGGIMTSRSAASFLTRVTVVLAILFLVNSLVLANMSSRKESGGVIDKLQDVDESEEVPIAE